MNGPSPPSCPLCAEPAHRPWSEQRLAVWWRCPGCGLFYVAPQPPSDALDRLYERVYYRAHDDPDADRARSDRIWSERVARIEQVCGPCRALDVGAGRGEFVQAARDRGWEAWGMEISAGAVSDLSEEIRARFTVGRAERPPFREAGFGLIGLFDVIEHVRQPIEFLRSVRELLDSDGSIVITTPNAATLKAKLLRSRWKYFEFERYLHLYHFDPATLESTLHRAGLRVRRWLRRRGMPLFVVATSSETRSAES